MNTSISIPIIDIPVGTVFKGVIGGADKDNISIFLKAYGIVIDLKNPKITWSSPWGGAMVKEYYAFDKVRISCFKVQPETTFELDTEAIQ